MKKFTIIILTIILILSFQLSVFADGKGMTLKLKNEFAYIYGYTDSYMGAENNITRAEAAALIHRLLKQNNAVGNYEKPTVATYIDVKPDTWFFTAVEFMTYKGVYIADNMNDVFRPYEAITRAEAAKLFAISLELKKSNNLMPFDDVDINNKYFDYIGVMVGNGFLKGDAYSNTIRPDSYLTRSEFVVIYNRIIGRNQSYSTTKTITGEQYVCPFNDIDESDWYYNDIVRATNSYTSRKIDLSKRNDRNVLDEYEIK